MSKKRLPKPDGLTGGLIRKSRVVYPPECTALEDRALFDDQLVRDRQAELVADAARDGKTIDRWYIDLAVTGQARGEAKRSGLAACRADAEAGTLTLLYTRDLSRIYRSVVKQEMFFADMERWGCTVRAQDIPQVGDPATQRLIRQNIGALNEYLAQRTGQLMEDRRLRNVREGVAVGQANSQWGLAYDPALKGYRYDPATADKARVVFEVLAESRGVAHEACRRLNRMWDEHAPRATLSPHGARWRTTTLLQVIRRNVYRRRAVRGEANVPAPHLIPEVVPPELVAEVDRLLALRAPYAEDVGRKIKAGRLDYTYGPLLRCGACGARMSAMKNPYPRPPGNVLPDGTPWPRWLSWGCSASQQLHSDCPEGSRFQQWRLDRLVGRVLDEAFRLAEPTVPVPPKRGRGTPKTAVGKDSLAAALAVLSTRRRHCLDMYERGLLKSLDDLTERVTRIDAEEARLLASLPAETDTPDEAPVLLLSLQEWARLRETFAQVYAPVTVQDLQAPGHRDMALDRAKHEMLKSLGVMLRVRVPQVAPRYPNPFYARRAEKRGGPSRQVGGAAVLTADIAALGLTGARALTVQETEADREDYWQWVGWARKQKGG